MRTNDRNERILQSLERKIAVEKFRKASLEKDEQKKIVRPYFILKVASVIAIIGIVSGNIYTYASYLIRYRFDTTKVLPEYVNILFMTPLVREQIAVMRRQGGGQYNLNSDEIGAIRIPVPSIPIQQEMISKYNNTKNGANIYYEKAKKFKKDAAENFESEIFS